MKITLIAHNIRSTHNVGSLLRTADGLSVDHVYLTGYTPAPSYQGDIRLPHLAEKITIQIHKTALGAENSQQWSYENDIEKVLSQLKNDGFMVAALEQSPSSTELPTFTPPQKIALLLGEEVNGIDADILKLCDETLEIPMFGAKESFNVSVAAGMALYHLRFKS